MIKKTNLLLALFAAIVGCGNAYSQTELTINRNDSTLFCNKCDSLYKNMYPNEKKTKVFGGPQVFPKFPGGEKALIIFLANNIQYPQECIEKDIEGRVIIQFIIAEDGKVICEEIRRSLHPAADEEALRVVKLMPNWQPASNNDIPMKMCYTVPVRFKLDTNSNGKSNFIKRIFKKLFGQ